MSGTCLIQHGQAPETWEEPSRQLARKGTRCSLTAEENPAHEFPNDTSPALGWCKAITGKMPSACTAEGQTGRGSELQVHSSATNQVQTHEKGKKDTRGQGIQAEQSRRDKFALLMVTCMH